MHQLINSFFFPFQKVSANKKIMGEKNEGQLPLLLKFMENRKLKNRCYLMKIPTEIWLKILSFLDHKEILLRVARTCKYFYEISNLCIIAMKIEDIPNNSHMKYLMYENIKKFKYIKVFKIDNYIDAEAFDQIVWTVLQYCPLLRDLALFRMNNKSIDHIVQFGDRLLSLEIKHGRMDGPMPIMELTKLKNLKKLLIFNIRIDEESSNDFLPKLAKHCENLSSLSLGKLRPKFSVPSIETFVESKKDKLKLLSLLDSSEWLPFLIKCKQLHTLDIFEIRTTMSKEDFIYLSKMAKTLQRLRLHNYGKDFSMKDVMLLFKNFSFQQLKQLAIDGVDSVNSLLLMVVINCPKLEMIACHTFSEISNFHTQIIEVLFVKIQSLRLVKLTFRQEQASAYTTSINEDLIEIVKNKKLSFILHQDENKSVITVGLKRLFSQSSI